MKPQYLIMDGRAIDDMDAALVLEVYGPKRPSKQYLLRNWPADSVVVRCSEHDGVMFCKSEIVWELYGAAREEK